MARLRQCATCGDRFVTSIRRTACDTCEVVQLETADDDIADVFISAYEDDRRETLRDAEGVHPAFGVDGKSL